MVIILSDYTWRYSDQIGVPEQWNGGYVVASNQSSGFSNLAGSQCKSQATLTIFSYSKFH